MKFKKITLGILSTLLLLTVVACGVDVSSGSSSSDTIKIGQIGPITGDAAKYGISTFNGAELAKEMYGDINGKEIQFVQIDDQANPADGVNAYNRLVDSEKVVAILGGITSGSTSAIADASQANQTPLLTPTATLESITLAGPNMFRACFIDPYQGEIMAKFALNNLGVTTAAIISNNGEAYSTGLAEAFAKEFEAGGGTIVAEEAYSATDFDFKTQLAKIDESGAEVLFAPDYVEKIALMAKQVTDLGLDVTMLGGDGWDGVFESVEDTSILNGSYIVTGYSPEDTDPTVQEFIAKYTEKYGNAPDGFAASGYDAAMVLFSAIEVADKNGELNNDSIIEALKNTEVKGTSGTITFDENRNAIKGAVVSVMQDGVMKMVEKVN